MSAFLIRRLLRFVVVCFGVSLVTFSILHASGDPIALIMPEAPEADRVQLRVALGLSDPLPTQFVRFVTNAARGNFGNSFFHREPAFRLVVERMPTTLGLTCLAVALAIAVALPVGIYSAVRRNTVGDHAATAVVFLGQSMPVFWIGIMLMLLFAVQWRLLPVSGWATWSSMVLPAVTLGAFTIVVMSTLQVAQAILAEAALSFLGVGSGNAYPTWGQMISLGRDFVTVAWWLATLPGFAILLTVLAINLVGDRLRDALDPRAT